MKKFKYLFILLIAVSLTIVSCDVLDEKIVSGVTSEYLDTPDGLDAGVNACYEPLRTYYGQESGGNLSEYGTDLYTHAGHGSNHYMDIYDAGLNAGSGNFSGIWANFYVAINTCNAVIGRAVNAELPQEEIDAKVAEARFLRAHYYFMLVQYFGPVYLTLDETVGVETEATRTTEDQVYEAIISDLEFAVANLPVVQSEFGRATQPAAKHMLALVHLTRGYQSYGSSDDFTTAASLAESVINDYGLTLMDDPLARYDHDNEQNQEVLWSVQFNEDPLLTPVGNETHLYFRPWYETYNNGLNRALGHGYGRPWIRFRPTSFLLNCFRVNGGYDVDRRFNEGYQQVWYYNTTNGIPDGASIGDTAIYLTGDHLTQAKIDAIEARLPGVYVGRNLYSWNEEDRGEPWSLYKYQTDPGDVSINIFPCPWKVEDNKRPSVNYQEGSRDFIVYSLPETYLVAAEALYKAGSSSEAADMINAVRTRAAYPGKENDMLISASDVTIDYILDERARELYAQYKRWLDLKRTGKLIERYKKYNPEGKKNNFIDEHFLLRPIPEDQITRTSGDFGQNPDY